MNRHLMARIGISAALLLVAACGKVGPLEPPPGASAERVPDTTPQASTMEQTIDPINSPAVTPQWPGTSSSTDGPR